jgi:glycosyltransferase involved in cell wall biosynthesis
VRRSVLEVSVTDLAGRRFDGYDLLDGLERRGWEARMAVFSKASDDPRVEPIGSARVRYWYERYLAPLEARLARPGHLGPAARQLLEGPAVRRASLVHLHVIPHGWFNLAVLPELARRKPVVWTLHDLWPLTGHCVHPLDCPGWLGGCGRCPDLGRDLPLAWDRTAQLWARKGRIYDRAPMTLVVASRWMERKVRQSPLLGRHRLRLIPFGLDPAAFAPRPRAEARRALGLAPDAPVVAYRAARPANVFKGAPYAVEALLRADLPPETAVLAFDAAGASEPLRARYRLHELAWTDDAARLATALAAADLFLMPSLAESFGMMALEAIACGTPVLAFADTALEDLLSETGGGETVPWRDTAALAAALARLLGDPARRAGLAAAGRAAVMRDYSVDRYVSQHAELYHELLGEGVPCAS